MTAVERGADRQRAEPDPGREVADAVRRALVAAALDAYEDAGLSGLCAEGRWEAAVSAMRALDVSRVVSHQDPPHPGPSGTAAPTV